MWQVMGTSALPRSKSLAKTLGALQVKGGCLQGGRPCPQGRPPQRISLGRTERHAGPDPRKGGCPALRARRLPCA